MADQVNSLAELIVQSLANEFKEIQHTEANYKCALKIVSPLLPEGDAPRLTEQLTQARIGIEWRDDCLERWCDSWNDSTLLPRRDEIQESCFDKTNGMWEKESSGISLSPYSESALMAHDAWRQSSESLHAELDRLGVPREGMGAYLRIRTIQARAEKAEKELAALEAKGDGWIPCSSRLPNDEEIARNKGWFAVANYGRQDVAKLLKGKDFMGHALQFGDVLFWQELRPLPAPPVSGPAAKEGK